MAKKTFEFFDSGTSRKEILNILARTIVLASRKKGGKIMSEISFTILIKIISEERNDSKN